jgi:23S rRNA pseudouridine1911/1915/1917 synthase
VTAFVVDRREAGQTLAAVVRKHAGVSWSAAKELIAERRVRLNGQTCGEIARRVKVGQRVDVVTQVAKKAPAVQRRGLRPVRQSPDGIVIRHADEHILVVEKPAGATTCRDAADTAEFGARGRKFLPKTLVDYLPALVADGLPIIPVHRLDRDTSGLVVFARSPEAAAHLGQQFRAHAVGRRYLAVTRGTPADGRIESWLVRDRGDGRRGSGPDGEGQRAVTHVKVLKSLGPLALVECRLETGRTHQVRIHLGEAGCPLAGERVYDRPVHGAPAPDPSGARRPLLHAAKLEVVHPQSGRELLWEAAVPGDFSVTAGGVGAERR